MVESRATICMILGAMTPEMAVEAVMKQNDSQHEQGDRLGARRPCQDGVPARQ
ncbi:MAG: hypothetical protein ACLT8E_02800 [Akkermansia sp.]